MSSAKRKRRKTALGNNRYRECTANCQRENAAGAACECPASWREPVVKGLYRDHRTSCSCSQNMRRTPKCNCPFVCDYADSLGQRRFRAKTYAKAITEFERRRAAHRDTIQRRRSTGITLTSVTAQQFFESDVLDPTKLGPRTVENYASTWACHHKDTFGGLPIDALATALPLVQAHLDALVPKCIEVRARTRTFAPDFILNVYRPLRRLLVVARTTRHWDENPARLVVLPDVPDPQPGERLRMPRGFANVVDATDVERIRVWLSNRGDARSEQDAAAVQLAFELCLRRSELRGLRVGDADVSRRVVTLEFQVDDAGRKRRPKFTKPADRPACFAIGRRLTSTLSSLLAQHPARDNPDAFLLFDDDPLKAMTRERFPTSLRRAQQALGMLDAWGDPKLTPHGLRHSGITHIARSGRSQYEITYWARHKDFQTTRKYIHLVDAEHLRETGEAFDP